MPVKPNWNTLPPGHPNCPCALTPGGVLLIPGPNPVGLAIAGVARAPFALPAVGSAEFERMIRVADKHARSKQPKPEEPVSREQAAERKLADAFLTESARQMNAIEQRTARKPEAGHA